MSKYNLPMELGENTIPGKIMRKITPGSTVLEFGCAEGRMTRYMQEKLECKVYIVELEKDAYKVAVSYAQAGVCADAELLTWRDAFSEVTFDYILFADVLEHLRNPEKVLRCARELLKEDGSVLVSIPNIGHGDILCNLYQNHFRYTELGLLDNTHIHFWGADDFAQFAADAGLQVVEQDGLLVPLGETEQKPDLSILPIDLEVALQNRQYGEVYQFLFELKKTNWVQKENLDCTWRIPVTKPSAVYFDMGEGFSERNMRMVRPEVMQGRQYVYVVDAIPDHCQAVRLDPLEGCGVFLRGIQALGDSGSLQARPANGVFRNNTFLYTNTDPQILISLQGPCKRLKIAIQQVVPIYNQWVLDFLDDVNAEHAETEEEKERLASQLDRALQMQQQIQKLLENVEGERRDLSALAEQRRIEIDQLSELSNQQIMQINQLAVQQNEMEERAREQELTQVRQREEITGLRKKLQDAEDSCAVLNCRLQQQESLNGELKKASAENQVLLASLQQKTQQFDQLEQQYHVISDAQCWKMTAPLRKVLDAIKRTKAGSLMHKTARCIRMFGWRVTLNKVRQHLRPGRVYVEEAENCSNQLPDCGQMEQMVQQLKGQVFGDLSRLYRTNNETGTRILLVSHELNLTGAPVALGYFAQSLKKQGHFPVVIAPRDGALRETLCQDGIPVIILENLYQSSVVMQAEALFDAVIVNTIVGAPIIRQMNGRQIPVMWWIHEAYASYHPGILKEMPERLKDNILACCVCSYAATALKQYRPEYQPHQMLYYVPDYAADFPETHSFHLNNDDGKLVFALVGVQEERKGQDILVEAIRRMDAAVRQQCLFVFLGKRYYRPIWEKIDELRGEYPENVEWIEELGRKDITSFYMQMDCLVCASRDDPMPIVVTEAMLMSKVVICSENAGSSALLKQMNSGIVYENNDPDQLARCLENVYRKRDDLSEMKDQARKTYECYFSERAFDSAVNGILQEMYEKRDRLLPYDGTVSVVIPTYNAGEDMRSLMELLNEQEHVGHVEVVVVDSGSRDGTAELAESMGATVIRIAQSEFSHSYARNLGAERAAGEYLLFMTQDAVPDGKQWICKLLQPVLKQNVAAVSCREEPKPDCDLLGRLSIWNHSKYMGILHADRIMSMPTQVNCESLRKNGQLNDVTCLVKKSVFDQFRYRGDYAEDLDLGIRLIRAGYKLALLSGVQVIHSHTRPAIYHLKRSLVDVSTLQKILPDTPMAYVEENEVINRVIAGYCVTLGFVEYLDSTCGTKETLEMFCQRNEYFFRQAAAEVKKADRETIEACLSRKTPYYDAELARLVMRVWKIGKSCYHYDGTLARDVLYSIISTVPDYLRENGQTLDETVKREISDLFLKRYAQLAGNLFAIYGLTHPEEDGQLARLIQEYWAGV